MKQKLLIFYIALLALVGGSLVVALLHDTKKPADASDVAVGGVNDADGTSKPNSAKKEASSVVPNKGVDSQYIPTTGEAAATPPKAKSNAPRQDEIIAQVRATQPEYTYSAHAVTPNDYFYGESRWALDHINAQAAWETTTGNGVVVAVIDTGFALQHEDLVDRWHQNSAECNGKSGVDDDGNGYVDDCLGWDFVEVDNNPQAVTASHGTETAGLSGATGNNGKGITTAAWNTKIIPLKVLGDNGTGSTSGVTAAVYYAVDNGAKVINMSLGGYDYDPALKIATDYAYSRGVVVIASSGNCGVAANNSGSCKTSSGQLVPNGEMSYPAVNSHVISVGATDSSKQRASFSSYGSKLDIVAPGSGSIYTSTWKPSASGCKDQPNSCYVTSVAGTSYSAPIVTSVVALVKSIRPNSTVDDIEALLLGSASKVATMGGLLYTNQLGHGMVDAGKAVTIATSLNLKSAAPTFSQTGGARSEHTLNDKETAGSGCQVANSGYCTVQLYSDQLASSRYLPYILANGGNAGWTWSGAMLNGDGVWSLRARQGIYVSNTPYQLSTR